MYTIDQLRFLLYIYFFAWNVIPEVTKYILQYEKSNCLVSINDDDELFAIFKACPCNAV